MREGGERPVLFADRVQWHPLLIYDDAGRADDFRRGPRADKDVVAALGVERAAKEGALEAAAGQAWLVLVLRWLEREGAASKGGEIHHARRAEGEALVRRDVAVTAG